MPRPFPEVSNLTSWLHSQRLSSVLEAVRRSGARSLLDLGCGDGDFLAQVIEDSEIDRIVGIDLCDRSLARARVRLAGRPQRVELLNQSITDRRRDLSGFDCAVLIETIEHIDPGSLSSLECAIFTQMRPLTVVVTTPNAEFNRLLGVPSNRFRHRDHRFEWDRATFARWVGGVADRRGYRAERSDIAGAHPVHGGASQMAVFRRCDAPHNDCLGQGAAMPHTGIRD